MKLNPTQSEHSRSQIIKKLELIEALTTDLAHHLLFWKQEYFSLLLDYNDLQQKYEEAETYISNLLESKQVVEVT